MVQDLFASSPTVLIKMRPACFNAKDAEEGRFQGNYLSFKWPAGIYWLYIWCVAYLNFNHIIVIKGTTLCFILLTKCYVVIIVSFTGPVVASSNSNIALSNDTILYKNKRLFRLVCSGVNPSTQPWLHQTESIFIFSLSLCSLSVWCRRGCHSWILLHGGHGLRMSSAGTPVLHHRYSPDCCFTHVGV